MSRASANEAGTMDFTENLVLVVDDDSRTRSLEKFVLEEEGFPVETVGTGEEALEVFGEISPALVLLDVNMPGIDGFATCQRIREISQVPIIMVTGEDRDEDKVRGLELGADDYLTKPFSTIELAARVKAVLRRHGIGGRLDEPPAEGRPAGTTVDQSGPEAPDRETVVQKTPTDSRPAVDGDAYEGTVKLMIETAGYIRAMIHFVDELATTRIFTCCVWPPTSAGRACTFG